MRHLAAVALVFFALLSSTGTFATPPSIGSPCPPGKRCVVEMLPISNSIFFNNLFLQIDLMNPTNVTQHVTVTIYSNGEIGFNPTINGTYNVSTTLDCTTPLSFCASLCYQQCTSKPAYLEMPPNSAMHHGIMSAVKAFADARSGGFLKIEVQERDGFIKGYIQLLNATANPTLIPIANGHAF